MPAFYREPDHRSEKTKVSSGSKANVLNKHKSTEEQPITRKVFASRASCTEKVSHSLYQSVNRFFMKLEEKVHAKEEETCQLQARKQEKKEAEIKQLRRNLNFKATPMPTFYREPGRRSEKNKDGQSWEKAGARAAVRDRWRMDRKREILDVLRQKLLFSVLKLEELASKTKSQSRPSTTTGARATNASANTVRCLRAEVYNRCSTNEHLNMANSPQVLQVTIHSSAELSNSSAPSATTSKTSKQTQSNRTVAPKRE
ncbi:hypothetical protein P3L10_004054 [Capsicum annuum]